MNYQINEDDLYLLFEAHADALRNAAATGKDMFELVSVLEPIPARGMQGVWRLSR